MKNEKIQFRLLLVVLMLVMAIPATAGASITAFKFLGIEGSGDSCDMNSRLGIASGSSEHVINIEDCIDYNTCTLEIRWGLDRTPATGTTYAVKVSLPGGACDDTDFTTLGSTCMDELLVDEKTLSSPNYMTFTIPFDYFTGGDCQAGASKSTKVYIIIKESGIETTAEVLMFDVDLARPDPPELQEPVEGDSNITVKWDSIYDSDDSTIQYKVYWSESSFSNSSKESAKSSDSISGISYQITGLTNDTEYFLAVSSVDENDNESVLSAVTSAMPIDVSDFWEYYQTAGGNEDGGFCFVATAAFGSYMAPEVMTLRNFRDTVLMTNTPGRSFVRFYYSVSPPLAAVIADSPVLSFMTRVAVMPLVIVARASLSTSPLAVALAGLLLLAFAGLFVGVAVRLSSPNRRRP